MISTMTSNVDYWHRTRAVSVGSLRAVEQRADLEFILSLDSSTCGKENKRTRGSSETFPARQSEGTYYVAVIATIPPAAPAIA